MHNCNLITIELHLVLLLNSLTAKSVPAGAKYSRSEGFLLAKHLKHTAHKHHHHDGAFCPSSGMVLLDEHTPPPGSLCIWGWPRSPLKGFSRINQLKEKLIYFFCLSVDDNNRSPAVGNDSQNGIHCCWRAAIIYKLNQYIATNNSLPRHYF